MNQNPYTLAALATAGVPGIIPVACSEYGNASDGIQSALVVDDQQRSWVVSAPTDASSGARLTQEVGVLQALSRTELAPFVQSPQGFADIPSGGRATVALALEGKPLKEHPHLFSEGDADAAAVAADLGRILALIHNTPKYAWDEAGVEEFTPKNVRRKHWENIKRAEKTQELPSAVVQRWMSLLAEDELWDFTPKFVHGGLNIENVLFAGDQISGLLHFENAAVADPAADIAWAMSVLDYDSFDTFFHAYSANLDLRADARLNDRAQLTGEFAVLEWLLAGIDTEDQEIISEALEMLEAVNEDLAQLAREEAEYEMAVLEAERAEIAEQQEREEVIADFSEDEVEGAAEGEGK